MSKALSSARRKAQKAEDRPSSLYADLGLAIKIIRQAEDAIMNSGTPDTRGMVVGDLSAALDALRNAKSSVMLAQYKLTHKLPRRQR